MITVGASSSTAESEQASPEHPKPRIPLMAIPITLAVGLLVGTVYVAFRIMTPAAHATPIVAAVRGNVPAASTSPQAAPQPAVRTVESTAQASKPSAFEAPPAKPSAAPAEVSKRTEEGASAQVEAPAALPEAPQITSENSLPGDSGLIAPRPGERYLQIAAISSRMVPTFLADLKKYHVEASLAPGPREELVRVVIGPFSDRASAAAAKEQIQAKWPDCFIRLY